MNNDDAVFHSDITKSGSESKNNLYDLLNIVPATPLPSLINRNETTNEHETTCSFTPNSNKRYIKKKVSKAKVKTVRDVRALYEHDVHSDLFSELEKQENYLMKKIRNGFSTNEHTKKIAKSVLDGEKPISTSAWQMLAHINPNNCKFPKQFVLWNGRRIQVNGSKGGKTKFICNHDLKRTKTQIRKSSNFPNSIFKRKMGLLRNSLNIKFKPGPLQKKKFLDESHHKYHMGKVELIPLPKPTLQIFPSFGTTIDPTVAGFINNLRGDSGLMNITYAEYAVSVLGKITNNKPIELDKKCITFDLNYTYDQTRLLMRRSDEYSYNNNSTTNSYSISSYNNENAVTEICTSHEVQDIVKNIIDSVEISLLQDDLYSVDDPRDTKEENQEILLNTKDKSKKKICELSKLDVTVIKLPQITQRVDTKPCGKSFCALGCICDSLNSSFNLKQHCGVLDCMFGCKCDLSKFKDIDFLNRHNPEIIPGLINLDHELNSRLAKEEQKFHQTVIVTGEESILLKSRKRKCKSSHKFTEFCRNLNLESKENIKKTLKIVDVKLDCKNIEPLCMVHNLYKCFCKGKFTESSYYVSTESNVSKTENGNTKVDKVDATIKNAEPGVKFGLRPRLQQNNSDNKSLLNLFKDNAVIDLSSLNCESNSTCARTCSYNGRKYSNGYYKNTNLKIKQMEENDDLLKSKMHMLMTRLDTNNPHKSRNISESESGDVSLYYDDVSNDSNCKSKIENDIENPVSLNTNKYNLRAWLEVSFRMYKERLANGLTNNSLKQPKNGLSCLLPWEVILNRYRKRKNVYFVSKQPPYRTFLGVNPNHPTFRNCLNIDDIRFAELPKYPVLVQNLVTNVTELNNSFCMLRGWDHCWELIGSAVRIVDNSDKSKCTKTSDTNNAVKQNDSDASDSDDWLTADMPLIETRQECADTLSSLSNQDMEKSKEKDNLNQERSKWFVMKIENDFTEIQFYQRGFFVSYAGIQQSIRFARLSGKTIRLSCQTRLPKNSSTPYGIYAIPSTGESCVFIGPYEENEPLGIEIVKTIAHNKEQETTRGFWITTNKIDNVKVINNPLSFMPCIPTANNGVSDESKVDTSVDDTKNQIVEIKQKIEPEKDTTKVIKPIKIRRTNIIPNVTSNNTIFTNNAPTIMKGSLLRGNDNFKRLLSDSSNASTSIAFVKPFIETATRQDTATNTRNATSRPIAPIAPQIKITSVYSESTSQPKPQNSENKSQDPSRMMILRPDEINKKVNLSVESTEHPNNADSGEIIVADVEGFLEESPICTYSEDILVISDHEDDSFVCKPIYIQCINIPNFGHFSGIKKGTMLSFNVPGFKKSDFYTESEAFDKINQILDRKFYIPKKVTLKWKVEQQPANIISNLLTLAHLKDKRYLLKKLQAMRKNKVRPHMNVRVFCDDEETHTESASTCARDPLSWETESETITLFDDLEETSKELENESVDLLNEAVTRHTEIGSSLAVPEHKLAEVAGALQDIFYLNNEL